MEEAERVRIDKWLWAARFFKTRSLATAAVEGGKITVNGDRPKPSRVLKVGDQLSIQIGYSQFVVNVLQLSGQRGPAPVARTLYEETAESAALREQQAEQRRLQGDVHGAGRPTKRDRRSLDQWRRGD